MVQIDGIVLYNVQQIVDTINLLIDAHNKAEDPSYELLAKLFVPGSGHQQSNYDNERRTDVLREEGTTGVGNTQTPTGGQSP